MQILWHTWVIAQETRRKERTLDKEQRIKNSLKQRMMKEFDQGLTHKIWLVDAEAGGSFIYML
ncbi:hypothetical protein I3760_05G177000 [Carya illinoinensis]|uniref:Uncharacterized protein n=1 Tax=Carya illinoinensis TaxID=32201 RepID=A0A8T1QL03_CARIL|nr:hypothetical protein I3760_05G177000 [Carya illinoinensis]KAG6654941.1 hypothetical protein CIPAW_05G180900 [Carya illinoinensis]